MLIPSIDKAREPYLLDIFFFFLYSLLGVDEFMHFSVVFFYPNEYYTNHHTIIIINVNEKFLCII